MNAELPSFARCYFPLVGMALVAAVIVAAIGYTVTHRVPIESAAVLAGCGVSWIASCIGAAPTALALSTNPKQVATAIMTSTAVRFVVVLMLVVPLVFSGWFPKTLFVVFVAISYMVILMIESIVAVQLVRRYAGGTPR